MNLGDLLHTREHACARDLVHAALRRARQEDRHARTSERGNVRRGAEDAFDAGIVHEHKPLFLQ